VALLQDLIKQVTDPELRQRILQEVDKLAKQKKFGLVFEEHLPECTPLYDVPIKKGRKVALKNGKVNDIYIVMDIKGNAAVCEHRVNHERKEIALDDLVSVAEFGEPIYPYLKPIDSVCNAPDSDLWHTLIEADNYHALQLLDYLYHGKVDCIYIDPPYNTGARDWKYNNDYVDSNDQYRHSKWLSFMEKRLKLAKRLLKPQNSVLIVTIDEKEYLHLGCLLEEVFPEANMQMISSVINPSGVSRNNEFYRTDEYIFILRFGTCVPAKVQLSDEWITAKTTGKDKLRWRRIRRQGSHDTRSEAANQFYPIYVEKVGKNYKYAGSGESLPLNMPRQEVVIPKNVIAIWPLKPDGTEGCWQISQQSLQTLFEQGYIKITYTKKWGITPQYLAKGEREKVENGQFPIVGKDNLGTIITAPPVSVAKFVPGTQWRITSHNAREHGSKMLRRMFGNKPFDFSKSLYAVADVLRFFVANNPAALVVDFFAGSGTTLHAINLLNEEDNGNRRCIIVTNNEVSESEAKILQQKGFKIGDYEWEALGIARSITWPRTVSSITGKTVTGQPISGDYGVDIDCFEEDEVTIVNDNDEQKKKKIYLKKSVPEYPFWKGKAMADGFKTNAAFFKLGFLDKNAVALGRQFKELLPVLWMKAGCIGPCPQLDTEELPPLLMLPENHFAVLLDETYYLEFDAQLMKYPEIKTVYIITDSESAYRNMIQDYEGKECYQLYRDYLDNFRINTGR
jgi:adenine-specific DNA-methyltransferase